jgi:hypothetical protein
MIMNNRLLTEHERQEKYLGQLPEGFEFPLFNSKNAIESQRKSGYRNSAAAAREIVDNAVEAGADTVHVVLAKPDDRDRYQRKDAVAAVAFIDNGAGMSPSMARYALSWGGGTHFEEGDQEFIGRFGFGLPNSSINQTRRVEVYTRRDASEPFWKAVLDINEITQGQHTQSVPPAEPAELPKFVQQYLKRHEWTLDTGTVVVWVEPDRLSYRTAASLKEHLLHDFGVTYRYLLKDFQLVVAGTEVQKVDPLFLMPDARYYLRPEDGGAKKTVELTLPVKYTQDPNTGDKHLMKVDAPEDLDDPHAIAHGAIQITVARFAPGFVVGRETKDVTPLDEFSKARFEIRKSRRGMSFVRAGREIETVDIFPRSETDKRSGLGEWPLLQGFAYHWAIEVRFPATLDDVFGITNDKQSVRPTEDFWRLLAQEEIDEALHREGNWQYEQRDRRRKQKSTATLEREDEAEPSPAEFAAQTADNALGDTTAVPDHKKKDANLNLERRAQQQAAATNEPLDEIRRVLQQQQEQRKYRVEYIEDEHGPFYVPEWEGLQVVVKINKRHPFFSTLYSGLLGVPGGKLAKEAVDLVLIALAREEAKTKNAVTAEFYRVQREERWSPFLATAMRTLTREYPTLEEEEAEEAAA